MPIQPRLINHLFKKFVVAMVCTTAGCAVTAPLQAQTTNDSIQTVVNQLFDAMRRADSAALVDVFAPGAVLQTIAADKQSGAAMVRTLPLANFGASVAKMQPGAADERIAFGNILVDGDMALVWTPYQFYLNGQFSHCGVNAFTLVRLAHGWKIQNIIDTRRRQHCPA